jgi:beta-lactamase regulating signal transducer with metallopeptidase domain
MIAYAMSYVVLAGLPIALAASAIARFLRTHGRAERDVWIAALFLSLAVPALMLSRPAPATPDAWLPPVVVEVRSVPASSTAGLPLQPSTASPDTDSVLLIVWCFVSLLLATRWIVSAFLLRRVSRSWLRETLDGVPISLTADVGPAVTGVLRPRIIVPAWVLALPPRQREMVLLHEREHIRAHDPWERPARSGRRVSVRSPPILRSTKQLCV